MFDFHDPVGQMISNIEKNFELGLIDEKEKDELIDELIKEDDRGNS